VLLLLILLLLTALPLPVDPGAALVPETACLCAVGEETMCIPQKGTCVCITDQGWVNLALSTQDETCPSLPLARRPSERERAH
jgi:hypothetical protein